MKMPQSRGKMNAVFSYITAYVSIIQPFEFLLGGSKRFQIRH